MKFIQTNILIFIAEVFLVAHRAEAFSASEKSVQVEQQYRQATALTSFQCPFVNVTCDPNQVYASFDGTCNNLVNTLYGSSNTPYKRLLPAKYDTNSDRKTLNEAGTRPLPNPRQISLIFNQDDGNNENFWTHIFTTFGQFLAHDITEAASSTSDPNVKPVCSCDTEEASCQSIPVTNAADVLGTDCMPFVRSAGTFKTLDCSDYSEREQLNLVSATIDASAVYGSSKEASDALRTFEGGKLLISAGIDASHPYIPLQDSVCSANGASHQCFKAGDTRENENLGLTGLHTVFVREHNRIAGELARVNPGLNDDQLFLETRRIVIAILQNIVYGQYVPSVIGLRVSDEWGLLPQPTGYFTGYDPRVNPAIYAEFATAAFRFGHSVAHNHYTRHNAQNADTNTTLTFSDINFNVDEAYNQALGGIDSILRGLINAQCGKMNMAIPSDLQNKLKDAPNGKAFDLASFNINRGRDHGLQSYVKYVEAFSGFRIDSFDNLTDVGLTIGGRQLRRLERLYNSVEDLDLWVMGIAEKRLEDSDSLLGNTLTHIFAQQFADLKVGDRYYFENAPDAALATVATAFTPNQLNEIKKMTLSTLLCNSLDLESVQPDVFFTERNGKARARNSKRSCADYDQIDFENWF